MAALNEVSCTDMSWRVQLEMLLWIWNVVLSFFKFQKAKYSVDCLKTLDWIIIYNVYIL